MVKDSQRYDDEESEERGISWEQVKRHSAVIQIEMARFEVAARGDCKRELAHLTGLLTKVIQGHCDVDKALEDANQVVNRVRELA